MLSRQRASAHLPTAEAHFAASLAVRASQLAREEAASAQYSQLAYAKRIELLTARLQRLPDGGKAKALLARLDALRSAQAAKWAERRAALHAAERAALQAALDAVVHAPPPPPPGSAARREAHRRAAGRRADSPPARLLGGDPTHGQSSDGDDEMPVVRGERIELRSGRDPLPH